MKEQVVEYFYYQKFHEVNLKFSFNKKTKIEQNLEIETPLNLNLKESLIYTVESIQDFCKKPHFQPEM